MLAETLYYSISIASLLVPWSCSR